MFSARQLAANTLEIIKSSARRSSTLQKTKSVKVPIANVLQAMRPGSAPKSSIISEFTGATSYPRVPLNQEFVPVTPVEAPQVSENVQVTTLENGVRVVSVDNQSPTTSLGVWVNAGSRNEDSSNSGVTHVLEQVALKSTANRNGYRVIRDAARIGANVSVSTSREGILLQTSSLRDYAPEALGIIADGIQNHAFLPEDVLEAVNHYEAVVLPLAEKPSNWVVEALHRAAFRDQTLGQPFYARNVSLLNNEVVKNYVKTYFTANRVVVAGVGIDHAELVALTKELFDNLPAGSPANKKATYVGGDARFEKVLTEEERIVIRDSDAEESLTHVAIAFPAAGSADQDSAAEQVLAALLGSSTGTSGRASSRLNANSTLKNVAVNTSSFHFVYTDVSLLGLYGSARAENAKQLTDALVSEAKALAGSISSEELARAKRDIKFQSGLCESKDAQASQLARQVVGLAQNAVAIDQVTIDDVKRVAQRLLKSKPTVALYGDISGLPDFNELTQALKL